MFEKRFRVADASLNGIRVEKRFRVADASLNGIRVEKKI